MKKAATNSGAVGFLLKQSSAYDVSRAIREVQKGNIFPSPSASKRRDHPDPQSRDQEGLLTRKAARLTSREMEVLQFIAEGKTNRKAASGLCISVKTVEKHRESLTKKLGIRGIAGLTHYAIYAGIVPCNPHLANPAIANPPSANALPAETNASAPQPYRRHVLTCRVTETAGSTAK